MQEILERLYSYSKFGIKLGLNNIKNLLNEMDNPQENYKIIHIAGTNGKGSVATILETVLLEAGFNVGKYTSPHLINFNERICFNNNQISDEDVVKYFEKVETIIKETDINGTFFEITTAMMFEYFKDKKTDWVILETGMGGKYDATNIVTPDITIITNISLDHLSYLGNTIEAIAKEKAGIVKSNIPLFYCDEKKEVQDIFKEKADESYYVLDQYKYKIKLDNEKFHTIIDIENNKYNLSLFGEFQGKNFITAYSVLKYIGIKNKIIKNAVKKVKWSGRFELIEKDPYLILDGAHNLDSAINLKKNILNKFNSEDIILIVSILKDKDIKEILNIFRDISDKIIFTGLEEENRGYTAEELYNIGISMNINCKYFNDINCAYKEAKVLNKKAILVAGSFYLVGKFKKEVLALE